MLNYRYLVVLRDFIRSGKIGLIDKSGETCGYLFDQSQRTHAAELQIELQIRIGSGAAEAPGSQWGSESARSMWR